ncbi:MAG: ABC transporter permease subunit [Candidatus Krumholzibacteria bacterium]|nr:ABC transporter permease subunit [Candidatus Krumholzibacteria bacterium]
MSKMLMLRKNKMADSATLSKTQGVSSGRRRLFWAVFKREMGHYLQTPGVYVALAFFLLLSGAFFTLSVSDFVAASAKVLAGADLPDGELPLNVTDRIITQLFSLLNFLMLLLVPMLTMRLISEERKSGTFELLVSTPLENLDILLGKFFAALAMGSLVLLFCASYPLICMLFSEPEIPVIISCFIGLFLIVMAYTAFGLFASSVTESQIAAAVLSFVGLLIFQMVDLLFKAGSLGVLAGALSVRKHSETFTMGIVSTVDVGFFILFTVFFLFLAVQVLDARRKG